MVSLNDALMELVTKKVVAPDEAYTKAVDKGGFEALLKRAGIRIVDCGQNKPKLAKLPANIANAMGIEPDGPPLDLRMLERGAYHVLVPLLQRMVQASNDGPAPSPANGGANGQAAASAAAQQQELLGG
jgi:hypothetical protein